MVFSCEKDTYVIDDNGKMPLAFNTDIFRSAGLKDNLFESGDQIGVMGYYLGGSTWTVDATPNFMYNQLVSYDGAIWNYLPLKYWSNDRDDNFKFFAYYPYNARGMTLSQNNAKGFATISYIPPTKASEHVDFLTATTATIRNDAGKSIVLSFAHQLSQLLFSIKHNGSATDEVKINSISLVGLKSYRGTYTRTGFEWDTNITPLDIGSYTATVADGEILPIQNQNINSIDYQDIYTESGVFLFSPQKIEANSLKITVNYQYKTDTEMNYANYEDIIIAKNSFELIKNKAINMQISLDIMTAVAVRKNLFKPMPKAISTHNSAIQVKILPFNDLSRK